MDRRYDTITSPAPGPRPRHRSGGSAAASLVLPGALFVASVVVLAAAVGFTAPRVGNGDEEPVVWLGGLAVVVGAGAALWSSGRLLRRVRRWWLLVLPMMLVFTYLSLWTVAQGVAAGFPAHPALGSRTPADVGLGYESVTVTTVDGVDLAAWWVPSSNGAAVVVLHGAGSTRTAVLDHAASLGSRGYGVLLLDARGHGASAGRGMDFGWYGERDVAAAVDFVTDRTGTDPDRIGVVGLSMGGEEAIGAAGADPRVRAVVAEGATNRVAADKAYLAAYGLRGEVQQRIDQVTYAVAGLLTAAPEPRPLIRSVADAQADGVPTPILLVTAGDVETELLAAERLQEAAPDAVEVWTVPGAAHTDGLETRPDEWEERVLGFLAEALAP